MQIDFYDDAFFTSTYVLPTNFYTFSNNSPDSAKSLLLLSLIPEDFNNDEPPPKIQTPTFYLKYNYNKEILSTN